MGVIALAVFANICAYAYLRPALPDVHSLKDVQLQVPLRIYTRDGKLIQSIGEQRRIPVRYEQLPKMLIQASSRPRMTAFSAITAWIGRASCARQSPT